MKMTANKIQKIISKNPDRGYLLVENCGILTDILYILNREPADVEDIENNGIVVMGSGFFEIQNCISPRAKQPFYGYTTVSGLDVRILDV